MEKSTGTNPAHVSGQANEPLSRPAHALTSHQVVQELGTDPSSGLTSEDAAQRCAKYGANDLGKQKSIQPVQIFIAQIMNAMTLVNIAAQDESVPGYN